MESIEVNIKPTIRANNIPDMGPLAVPGVGKLKQSRYEDVWPEDVHAAFMEAIALYPPMGKRRLKYYRVSTRENEDFSDTKRAKSFGRCQLIQSYILEKTGKNRSRKQVSSHLQRLKKIHKDNPAMQPLFSERFQLPSEHCSGPQAIAISSGSQDVFTDIPISTCHIKSDLDSAINLQDTDTGAVDSSTFSSASEPSSCNGGSCNAFNLSADFHDQPSFFSSLELLSPAPQQCPAVPLHPSDSNHLSELQDPLLFNDAIGERFRSGSAFNTSAFSISMGRLSSKVPLQSRLVDLGPTMHFSRAVNSPGFQPTHHWVSHDSLIDGASCSSSLASAQEAFHPPFLPLQLIPFEKQRLDPGLASEWIWPKNPDLPLDLPEGSFGEIRLRYPPAMYQYNPTCPDMRVNTPGSHSSPSESEVPRLPRGVSYSYALTSPTGTTASGSLSNLSAIDFPKHPPESSENLASPFVIRPTPVYPISYIHSNIHSNTYFDGRTLAPSLS